MKRVFALGLAGLLGLSGCRRGTVDTTKDVYDDSDAPEFQIYELNGTTTQIPWENVPVGRRWLSEGDSDGGYKWRVPIVRVEVTANDKDGNPCEAVKGKVWEGYSQEIGLNPKYVRTAMLGERR